MKKPANGGGDLAALANEAREQLRARPYLTLLGLGIAGYLIGRQLPVRALLAVGGIGARAAVTTAVEGALRTHSSQG